MRAFLLLFLLPLLALSHAAEPGLFEKDNLMAWCIVPFDAKKRGPEERAAMLDELGFKKFAYDYRAEHIPSWDAELEALKKHKIELTAWWFPPLVNAEARASLELFKTHGVTPQLWVTGGGNRMPSNAEEQQAMVRNEGARIHAIAETAARYGCKVGLYNHGGWFGEPENQVAIIEHLKTEGVQNVGIVYNLHHGHGHLGRFAELLGKMKPYLLALNLNGMTPEGDKKGKKIQVIGQGELDAQLLKIIADSGWRGPIGILNHTDEDAETRLRANLEGLEKLLQIAKTQESK